MRLFSDTEMISDRVRFTRAPVCGMRPFVRLIEALCQQLAAGGGDPRQVAIAPGGGVPQQQQQGVNRRCVLSRCSGMAVCWYS